MDRLQSVIKEMDVISTVLGKIRESWKSEELEEKDHEQLGPGRAYALGFDGVGLVSTLSRQVSSPELWALSVGVEAGWKLSLGDPCLSSLGQLKGFIEEWPVSVVLE